MPEDEKIDLTKLKKGDRILLKKACNVAIMNEGKMFEIVSRCSNYYTAKLADNSSCSIISIYFAGSPNDEFCLADRKEQAKYLRQKIADLKVDMAEMEQEAFRLEKFESEEAYVAYKLDEIMKANKKGGAEAMTKVLKTLKESHML
jgi:hypothetical protein